MLQRRRSIRITGGSGSPGPHLTQRPLDPRNRVICVNHYYTGSPDISLPLRVYFKERAQAETDRIAAA